MIFDKITQLFRDTDEIINEFIEELEAYENIVNLKELTDICEIIKENNLLKEFDEISKNEYKTEEYYPLFEENKIHEIPFFKSAREILGVKFQYVIGQKLEEIDYANIKTLIYLIFINYKKYNPEKNTMEIIEKCAKSNYMIKLTLQNFKDENNPPRIFDIETTLVKIKNTKFENDEIKEFNMSIIKYIVGYVGGRFCSFTFFNHVKLSPIYLMACSAVKNNRDITYEDVIQGHIQTLKIFTEDLTPEIEKYYEEI